MDSLNKFPLNENTSCDCDTVSDDFVEPMVMNMTFPEEASERPNAFLSSWYAQSFTIRLQSIT